MRRSVPGSSAGACRGAAPRWAFVVGLALLAGCSGGDTPAGEPEVWPEKAGAQAVADYDTNKDGLLDAKELEPCPGLLGAMKRLDKNGDGHLSADEIRDRLAFFQQMGPQTDAAVEVTLDGRPLAGATVTLVPEKFMGPSLKSASTVTNPEGTGYLMTEGTNYVQVAHGYYKVQVSKVVQGREVIPARYNTQTVLGQEVAPERDGRGSRSVVRLRLSSR
jgi:hypothetical protein